MVCLSSALPRRTATDTNRTALRSLPDHRPCILGQPHRCPWQGLGRAAGSLSCFRHGYCRRSRNGAFGLAGFGRIRLYIRILWHGMLNTFVAPGGRERKMDEAEMESSCMISAEGSLAGGGVCWIGVFSQLLDSEMKRVHYAILWCLSLASGHDLGCSLKSGARLVGESALYVHVAGPGSPFHQLLYRK